jgi:hypothetical protein
MLLNKVRRWVSATLLYHYSKCPYVFFVCPNFFLPRKIFLFLFVFVSANLVAINRTLKAKRQKVPRLLSILLALHIDSWVLFYLNFLVYILIYPSWSFNFKWENRKFFGGLDRYSLTPLSLSLSLSLSELTYSHNKMTSHEIKNRFSHICLLVTTQVTNSPCLQVPLSVRFAPLNSFPSSHCTDTLNDTPTFRKSLIYK